MVVAVKKKPKSEVSKIIVSATQMRAVKLWPWLITAGHCPVKKRPGLTLRYASTAPAEYEKLETVEDWAAFQIARAERKQLGLSIINVHLCAALTNFFSFS
jgi:hypothetical protein